MKPVGSVTIGVFDSGIGGLSVAKAIEKALPNNKVIFVNDHENVPYGTKSPDLILQLVVPILNGLVEQGCRVIVIACNTVTTTIIKQLRAIMTVPLIGIEPMVKSAVEQTRSKIIAVCATPTTLRSERYHWLKQTYAIGITVLEPDCSDWTSMIESNQVDHQKIFERIDDACRNGADVIVLGCTHYHWIEDLIKQQAAGRAKVIQPEQAVIKQLKLTLGRLA